MSLSACVNFGGSPLSIIRNTRLGLYVSLMNRLGIEFAFNGYFRFFKTFCYITQFTFHPSGDVRWFFRFGFHTLGKLILMKNRSVGFHCLNHVDYMG